MIEIIFIICWILKFWKLNQSLDDYMQSLPLAPPSVQRPPSTQKPLEIKKGPQREPPATHPMSTLQNFELASQMQPRHSCVAASPDAPLNGSWHVFGGSKIDIQTQ